MTLLVMSNIGDYIVERMRELDDMSQSELARASGVSGAEISRIISGNRKKPGQKTLKQLAGPLKTSYAELLRIAGYDVVLSGSETAERQVKRPANVYPVSGLRAVPVIGTIPAGMPLVAIEEVSERIMFPEEFLPPGNVFFLSVKGDSMEGERIFDGDMVLINADEQVDDMEIGAVMVDDEEVTLKKVHYIADSVALLPANSKYRPSIHRLDEVRILGRYKFAIHR
jgi:repressor LexA